MWRSLVARTVRDREAASSSLVTSTKCFVPEKYGAHVDIFGDFFLYINMADFDELFVAISDDTDITVNKNRMTRYK